MRLDTGIREGDAVSVFYDSMIGKLVELGRQPRGGGAAPARRAGAHRDPRRAHQPRLPRAAGGPPGLPRGRHRHGVHRDATAPSCCRPRATCPLEALVAAAARVHLDERAASPGTSPWDDAGGWRLNQPATRTIEFRRADGESVHGERRDGRGPRRGRGRRAQPSRRARPRGRRAAADRARRRDVLRARGAARRPPLGRRRPRAGTSSRSSIPSTTSRPTCFPTRASRRSCPGAW